MLHENAHHDALPHPFTDLCAVDHVAFVDPFENGSLHPLHAPCAADHVAFAEPVVHGRLHPLNAHSAANQVLFAEPVDNGSTDAALQAMAPSSSAPVCLRGEVAVETIGQRTDCDLLSDAPSSSPPVCLPAEVVVETISLQRSGVDLPGDANADIASARLEHCEASNAGKIREERGERQEHADSDVLVVLCEAGDLEASDKIQEGAGSWESLVVDVESHGGHSDGSVGDENPRLASPDLQKTRTQEAVDQGKEHADYIENEGNVTGEATQEAVEEGKEHADRIENEGNVTGEATSGKASTAEVHLPAVKRRKKKKKTKKQAVLASVQRYLEKPGKQVPLSFPISKKVKKSKLAGAIFFCNRHTMEDCFRFRVFGLPWSQKDFVKRISPGTILFLFEYESRQLAGIYEAISHGGINLEPAAYQTSPGSFPAQVFFRIIEQRPPLEEWEFRAAIEDNYYSGFKFKLDLTSLQVDTLCTLFRGKSFDSTITKFEVLPGSVACLEDIYQAHSVHEDAPGHVNDMVHDAAGNTTFLGNYSGQEGISREHDKEFSSHGESATRVAAERHVLDDNDITCTASDVKISPDRLGIRVPLGKSSYNVDRRKRNSIEKIGTIFLNSLDDLSSSLYCDKVDHKVSVWDRISVGDTRSTATHTGAGGVARAVDFIDKDTGVCRLARGFMDSIEKEVYPQVTDESSAEEEFNISALDSCFPSTCVVEDYAINFKRRRKPSFVHGVEAYDEIQLKKRRKIVRPDFSCFNVTSVFERESDRDNLDRREKEHEFQWIERDTSFVGSSIGIEHLERSDRGKDCHGKTSKGGSSCLERGEYSCLEGGILESDRVPVSIQFMDLDLRLSLRKGHDGFLATKEGIVSNSQCHWGIERPCISRDERNVRKNGFLTSPISSEGVDLDLKLCLNKVF